MGRRNKRQRLAIALITAGKFGNQSSSLVNETDHSAKSSPELPKKTPATSTPASTRYFRDLKARRQVLQNEEHTCPSPMCDASTNCDAPTNCDTPTNCDAPTNNVIQGPVIDENSLSENWSSPDDHVTPSDIAKDNVHSTTTTFEPAPSVEAEVSNQRIEVAGEGRRIISVESFKVLIGDISNHAKHCKNFEMKYTGEVRDGLHTEMRASCNCGYLVALTSDTSKESLPVNKALSWGCHSSGTGYTAVTALLTTLDIPSPCQRSFGQLQDITWDDFVTVSEMSMREAAEEEKRLAILAGDYVTVNGIKYPCILVIVDGQWAKRTYGHGYDSNCGAAVIIGWRTGKILYVATRTTTCYKCKRAEAKEETPAPHVCFKNWDKPSTAMEHDIIAQGFRESIEKYELVYSRFVGDGDSNVYKSVIDAYPGITVEKTECSNHAIKNFRKHLIEVSKNKSKDIPTSERKIPAIGEKFNKITNAVVAAINHYAKVENTVKDHWKLLYEDIMNIPNHVFGDHRKCKGYFCNPVNHENDQNHVPEMAQLVIWKKLMFYLKNLANKSRSLVEKMNTNKAESFMSVCNKFLEGKRKNFGQKSLYALRITCAVLSYNLTTYFPPAAFKMLYNKPPTLLWTKRDIQSEKMRNRKKSKQPKYRKLGKFSFLKPAKGDKNYGSNPEQPDISPEELSLGISKLKSELAVTPALQAEIELKTRKQSGTELWFEERTARITASVCGEIFKMRDTTQNTRILNRLFRVNNPKTKGMQWGNDHEKDALLHYVAAGKVLPGSVKKSGLVVSLENGIFAASPDAIVGEDGLVEIKCPYSCRDKEPMDWSVLQNKAGIFLQRSSPYYNQIVMLLHVTQRKWCDLVVWTPRNIFVERIYKDDNTLLVWQSMVPKLQRFWENELAPEVVDSRRERGMNYRVPSYRALPEAHDKKNKKKK